MVAKAKVPQGSARRADSDRGRQEAWHRDQPREAVAGSREAGVTVVPDTGKSEGDFGRRAFGPAFFFAGAAEDHLNPKALRRDADMSSSGWKIGRLPAMSWRTQQKGRSSMGLSVLGFHRARALVAL